MTPCDSAKHHYSIRLKGYDYTRPGAYFVTMVTFQRLCLFGEIVDEAVLLNTAGRIVCAEWKRLERVFVNIELGAFVVMPNHVHGFFVINEDGVGATHPGPYRTGDGEDRLPDGSRDGVGGSPLRVDHSPDGSGVGDAVGVGATRLGVNRTGDGEDRLPDESRDGVGGSPLHGRHRTGDGEDRSPDKSRVGIDGSPHQPNGPATGSRIWAIPGEGRIPIWQRSDYEHIVRDKRSLERIQGYILENPARWEMDRENHQVKKIKPLMGLEFPPIYTNPPEINA